MSNRLRFARFIAAVGIVTPVVVAIAVAVGRWWPEVPRVITAPTEDEPSGTYRQDVSKAWIDSIRATANENDIKAAAYHCGYQEGTGSGFYDGLHGFHYDANPASIEDEFADYADDYTQGYRAGYAEGYKQGEYINKNLSKQHHSGTAD